jgi:hypothetical protein
MSLHFGETLKKFAEITGSATLVIKSNGIYLSFKHSLVSVSKNGHKYHDLVTGSIYMSVHTEVKPRKKREKKTKWFICEY